MIWCFSDALTQAVKIQIITSVITQLRAGTIMIMQKDALNNVHISDEQILITPEELKIAFH